MIVGKTHDELLYKIAKELQQAPMYSPRGMKTKEIINAHLELTNPYARLIRNVGRKFSDKYVAAEISWYLSGERSIERIKDYASMWERVANPDGTANSAYGFQIWKMPLQNFSGSQYDWVISNLVNDKDSRQATININLPEHKDETTKDFVCTQGLQFLIRDNRLHLINTMRSNDAIYGTGNDIPFFTFLQEMVLEDLRDVYADLQMGSYYHNVGSLHVYDRHFYTLDRIVSEYERNVPESSEMPWVDKKFLDEYVNGQWEKDPQSDVGLWLRDNK